MKKLLLGIIVFGLIIFSCKSSSSGGDSKKVGIQFESKSSSNVQGTAVFIEKNGIVSLEAKLTGLKPGVHAIHIHEK